MLFIDNMGNTDPRFNLALEEYFIRNADMSNSYLLFYINEPSVIVGKHQNIPEEVNLKFAEENHIPIYRRISGGGAVYHDLGNLNFSYITRKTQNNFNNYRQFLKPILDTLINLGLPAEITAHNNIVIKGKKISGNAQFTSRERMCSHGTLLFNSNLASLKNVLLLNKEIFFQSKSTKSKPENTANITDFLAEKHDLDSFRRILIKNIYNGKNFTTYNITSKDLKEINKLKNEKYSLWNWNYGLSPMSIIKRTVYFSDKPLTLNIAIDQGLITSFEIKSKLLTQDHINSIKTLFIEQKYTYDALYQVDLKFKANSRFSSLQFIDWLNILF